MLTYSEARQKLNNKAMKKVANNTYLVNNSDGTIGIQLHATQVVVINPENTFKLSSGGYRNLTTKSRINDFSPAKVYQEKFTWFVSLGPGRGEEFYDGITVDAYGELAK